MKLLNLNRNSIIIKVGTLMLMLVLLQAAFSAALIFGTGVSDTLEAFSSNLFIKSIQNRHNYLEGEMLNNWSNIDDYVDDVEGFYRHAVRIDEEYNDQMHFFLDSSLDTLIDMLWSTGATGGFIIMDDANGESVHTALYITNSNYSSNIQDNNALQIVYGSSEISKEHKIPLSNIWSYGMNLGETNECILRRPIYATTLTDNSEFWGYWHFAYAISGKDSALTYSIPIMDENSNPVGVMGIEVTQNYLYRHLPFDDFSDTGSYGYTFANIDTDTRTVSPLMVQGTVQQSILGEPGLGIPYSPIDSAMRDSGIYLLQNNIEDVAIYSEKLELYHSNTPFAGQEFHLVGITSLSNITSFSNEMDNTVMFMIIISAVFGVFFAYLVGYRFSRPIVNLSNKMMGFLGGEKISFSQVGIYEIDELSNAISQLNDTVLRSSHKTEKILDMMDIGVGSFEHIMGEKQVTISSALCGVMGFEPEEDAYYKRVDEASFFVALDKLKESPEPDFEETYLTGQFPESWHRITQFWHDAGILGVVMDVTKDVLERRAIKYERDYDMLTGIFNRLAFHRAAGDVFAKGNLKVAAMVMFDLDNLKYANDTFGHDAGDMYIKSAARYLNTTFTKNAVIGRMSGDEFFVFFYGFNAKEEIFEYLNTLYSRFENEPLALNDGTAFKIRMSGGIAWYGEDSTDFGELIRFADFAMYEGKHTLKGELREFSKEVYLAESFMHSGKEELNRVLDNEFIDFVFQPIISAETGEIYAYEALMRPRSEILNTPIKLLQISTAQSKLWKVEKITFFKTLSLYAKHQDLFGDAKLFINSVPNKGLKEEEYDEFERLYRNYLDKIVVEIIETERLDEEVLRFKLDKISSWGSKIALDDYGSGYNSDLHLLNISPHIVKLDRSIIADVHVDVSRQAIVSKITSFCKEQGIMLLAEGVETEKQMHYLIRSGIDLIQGYFVSKPMPLPTFDTTEIKGIVQKMRKDM